jgi:hypothetical protein
MPSGVVMIDQTAPHYLLLTQAQSNPDSASQGGVWRFVLEQVGSSNRTEVSEEEPGVWGERLQLLAVVRGLEALEQPSRVTLITPSRFVGNGIRRGINEWRENGWQSERFGQLTTVKHCELWKRVDQALQYHQINCRVWEFEEANFRIVRSTTRNRISFGEIESARKTTFANASANSASSLNRSKSHLYDQPRPEFVGAALDQLTKANNYLANRVKPVGAGRAYGYAVN